MDNTKKVIYQLSKLSRLCQYFKFHLGFYHDYRIIIVYFRYKDFLKLHSALTMSHKRKTIMHPRSTESDEDAHHASTREDLVSTDKLQADKLQPLTLEIILRQRRASYLRSLSAIIKF